MHFLPQDRQTIPLGAAGADEEGRDYGPYPVGTAAAEIWTLDPFARLGSGQALHSSPRRPNG